MVALPLAYFPSRQMLSDLMREAIRGHHSRQMLSDLMMEAIRGHHPRSSSSSGPAERPDEGAIKQAISGNQWQ